MMLKSVIVFAVLDDGAIHQVLLSEEEKKLIKNTLHLLSRDGIKCSNVDFSTVIELSNTKKKYIHSMINWIKVNNDIYYKQYYTGEVVAINTSNNVLIGYLSPNNKGGLVCEVNDTVLENVAYYAPVEELLNTQPI